MTESRCAASCQPQSMTARLPSRRTTNCTPRRSVVSGCWHCGMLFQVSKSVEKSATEGLIDQLWSAIEALPDPEPEADAKRPSKQNEIIAMLRRPEGAT